MEPNLKTEKLRIEGMTCINCQNKIENNLLSTTGVRSAAVNYGAGTAVITYDEGVISLDKIEAVIEKLDYRVLPDGEGRNTGAGRMAGMMIIIVALYVLLEYFGVLNMLAPSGLADVTMGYGMLFVIGLMTSVHCIAMCGGINLSQCIPRGNGTGESRLSVLEPSLLYNLGRVVSYTVIGFIVGALGSAITFSVNAQGIMKLIAGIFMIIMGINLLGIFPYLSRLNPGMPKIFAQKIHKEKEQSRSPLIVGLLNGLMPCGPLQAMQIYALSTGDPFAGALSMFLFSIGTLPLMFGLGAVSSALGKKFTAKVMTVGAVLVVVLGLSMFSQGWSMSGFTPSGMTNNIYAQTQAEKKAKNPNDVQIINSTLSSYGYPNITVRVGVPVKWIIDAPKGSINGCNNRIFIQEYGIEHRFTVGRNVIEFMPAKTGRFQYSCWMGMIRAAITVTEAAVSESKNKDNSEFKSAAGCCCCN